MRLALDALPEPAIERLERAAGARPRLFQLGLITLAVLGDIVMTLVRVLPFALPVVFGVVLYRHWIVDVVAGLALVFLVWVLRPSARPAGREMSRRQAPALFSELDELGSTLQSRGRLEVRLDDEMNAGAREFRGLLGLLGRKRVLTLGVPLMAILTKDEVRAVVAHELGHFSRRHGRFGHWLYWAHLDWLSQTQVTGEDSTLLDRGGAAFASLFAPIFSRRAMVWSRRCEYEADADAARAVGGTGLISGLLRLDLYHHWQETELPRLIRTWQAEHKEAPAEYLARIADAFGRYLATADTAALIARAGTAQGNWADTHPSIAARAQALGVPLALSKDGEAAGPALCGDAWGSLVTDFDARWRREHTVEWAVAHARHHLIDVPLAGASADETRTWPTTERLRRAISLRRLDPKAGLACLEALHRDEPSDHAAAFQLGAALVAERDARGIGLLTNAAGLT